jgi:hypothetical protein
MSGLHQSSEDAGRRAVFAKDQRVGVRIAEVCVHRRQPGWRRDDVMDVRPADGA